MRRRLCSPSLQIRLTFQGGSTRAYYAHATERLYVARQRRSQTQPAIKHSLCKCAVLCFAPDMRQAARIYKLPNRGTDDGPTVRTSNTPHKCPPPSACQCMRQASSLPACAVCHESLGKYKCPCCRLPYCGVACYKQHKASPCAAPPVAGATARRALARWSEINPNACAPPAALPPQPPREFEADEADEEGLRLKQADLQRLGAPPEQRRSVLPP